MICLRCGKEMGDKIGMCDECKSFRTNERKEELEALRTLKVSPYDTVGTPNKEKFAGFWIRLLAFIIDFGIVGFFMALVNRLIEGAANGLIRIYTKLLTYQYGFSFWALVGALIISSVVVNFLLGYFYYAICEASKWQATPGKRLLGLFVETTSGDRLTFKRATVRYLARGIGLLPVLIGTLMALAGIKGSVLMICAAAFTYPISFLLIALDEQKQGAHDRVAACVVKRPALLDRTRLALGLIAAGLVIFTQYKLSTEVKRTRQIQQLQGR